MVSRIPRIRDSKRASKVYIHLFREFFQRIIRDEEIPFSSRKKKKKKRKNYFEKLYIDNKSVFEKRTRNVSRPKTWNVADASSMRRLSLPSAKNFRQKCHFWQEGLWGREREREHSKNASCREAWKPRTAIKRIRLYTASFDRPLRVYIYASHR